MRRKRTAQDNPFAAALVRFAVGTVGRLPVGLSVNLGAAVGALAHTAIPIRRKLVRQNLELALGDSHAPAELRRLEAATFRHLGMLGAEVLALWRHGPDWVESQIAEVHGMENAQPILDAKQPFLVVTAHFGNWEMLGVYFGRRLNLSVLAKPLHNQPLDRELNDHRQRLGLEVLTANDATIAQDMQQAIRRGRTVCFLADQDARRTGTFVPFFGRPASTFLGPALMAIRQKMPIVPAFLLRLGPGRHRVLVRPPLHPPEGLPLKQAVAHLTAAHVKALEDVIRLAPSQYFWFHRRWKTQPRPEDAVYAPSPTEETQ